MTMINIKCEKCGNEEIVMKPSATGAMVGAYCKLCGSYIKWLSKDELKQVKKVQLNTVYGVLGNKILEVKVKYLRDVEHIAKIKTGDWIDLRVAENTYIPKGGFYYIPLGVAIQLPDEYEAIVAPRSSTFKNFGVIQTNSIGVIDESYCGDNDEWHFPCYATRNTYIPKNTRICQFRIIKHQPEFVIREVQQLGNKDRGGLGSTGTQEYTDTDSIMSQKDVESAIKSVNEELPF